MNREQVREMEIKEYENAVKYCWWAYCKRDVNYNLREFFKSNKNPNGDYQPFENVDWSGINPVEQELRKKRRIPPRYKEYLDSLEKVK